jgi:hypothetical protein
MLSRCSPAQLQSVTDTLVTLHARFWEDLQVEILDPAHPIESVTRSAQAWPAAVIETNATAVRHAAASFLKAVSADITRPRVIDWSELKPGLGPHDLAYCLLSAPTQDRPARDLALLRRYWEGLGAAGVEEYGWELCLWDYRFSLLTNLFQSVFQKSLTWFRRTAALIAELDCRAALRSPPPIS